MKPSAEICEQGLRAYEQVGAFERMRPQRGLVASCILAPAVFIALAWAAVKYHHVYLGVGCIADAFIVAALSLWQWHRLRTRHERNIALLASLERQFGPDLPWLEVERHMAALKRIVADIDREKGGRTKLNFTPNDGGLSGK